MKRLKIFMLLAALLLAISCGTTKKVRWYNIGEDGQLIEEYNRTMNRYQLDSLFSADTLPSNFKKWPKSQNRIEDKNEVSTKYFYVKNRPTQETYIIENVNDSLYTVIKRKINLK